MIPTWSYPKRETEDFGPTNQNFHFLYELGVGTASITYLSTTYPPNELVALTSATTIKSLSIKLEFSEGGCQKNSTLETDTDWGSLKR